MVKASARLLEGRFAEAAVLNDTAFAVGGPNSEAGFFHLIFRAALARLTGEDADEVQKQVRRTVDDLPYLARGWRGTAAQCSQAGGDRVGVESPRAAPETDARAGDRVADRHSRERRGVRPARRRGLGAGAL